MTKQQETACRIALNKQKQELAKWAEKYIENDQRIYGTDKHGIALRDLLNKLKRL